MFLFLSTDFFLLLMGHIFMLVSIANLYWLPDIADFTLLHAGGFCF